MENAVLRELSESAKTDIKRIYDFKKGDIYICNLDEDESKDGSYFSTTGLIGKTRPCFLFSIKEYNDEFRNTYTIMPIKTNNTGLSTEEYIRTSHDIVTPIWIDGVEKFIVVNQARPLCVRKVIRYLGTVVNPDVLIKVDELFLATHFCGAEKAKEISLNYGNFENAVNFLCSEDAKSLYSTRNSLE